MAVYPSHFHMGNVSIPFEFPQPHLSQGMAMLSIHFVGSLSAAIGPYLVEEDTFQAASIPAGGLVAAGLPTRPQTAIASRRARRLPGSPSQPKWPASVSLPAESGKATPVNVPRLRDSRRDKTIRHYHPVVVPV